jgi:hypothetical protein
VAGTLVVTPEGLLPVELLGPGDRVATRRGFARLVAVDWRRVSGAQVVVIGHGAPGPGWLQDGVAVAPGQPVTVTGRGTLTAAALPADDPAIRRETRAMADFVRLRFAAPQCVLAGTLTFGCEGAAPRPAGASPSSQPAVAS